MVNRMISLTVGTQEAEEWIRTFQEISELATNLGVAHHYVSVSSSVLDEQSEEPDENLVYDENTLQKVRTVLRQYGMTDELVTDVINEMLNIGLLFRERR